MDGLGNVTHSLIFRAGNLSEQKGRSQDNYTPFENLVPKNLRKDLLTPQGRIKGLMATMARNLREGNLPAQSAMRLLGILRMAILQEQQGVIKQLEVVKQKEKIAPLARIAHGVARLEEGISLCMAALHEGTQSDFEKAATELEKNLSTYEHLMESLVSLNESHGWLLLQRFRGPFSPVLSVLGWGITMHLAGLVAEKSFKSLLTSIESEMEKTFKNFKPGFFFMSSWKEAENAARTAFQLVRVVLINRETLSSGIIDPTSLRGALASLAKVLCHLNVLASSFHPGKMEEDQAFSGQTISYVGKKEKSRHIMGFPSEFFSQANPLASN